MGNYSPIKINERRKVLKFYSGIKNKPNSVIKEIKDGTKVVDSKLICTFHNGELEIDDPEIIEELEKHPDLFRKEPFPNVRRWEDTKEGEELLKKAKELNIDTRHIRKEYLISLINEREEVDKLSYQELVKKAKELDIPTHKRKKEDILNDLKKEVMIK